MRFLGRALPSVCFFRSTNTLVEENFPDKSGVQDQREPVHCSLGEIQGGIRTHPEFAWWFHLSSVQLKKHHGLQGRKLKRNLLSLLWSQGDKWLIHPVISLGADKARVTWKLGTRWKILLRCFQLGEMPTAGPGVEKSIHADSSRDRQLWRPIKSLPPMRCQKSPLQCTCDPSTNTKMQPHPPYPLPPPLICLKNTDSTQVPFNWFGLSFCHKAIWRLLIKINFCYKRIRIYIFPANESCPLALMPCYPCEIILFLIQDCPRMSLQTAWLEWMGFLRGRQVWNVFCWNGASRLGWECRLKSE